MKDFTRFLVLELVDEGGLELDDPLSGFFENVPEDKSHITVRQLLAHRVGLTAYHGERTDSVPADHLIMSEAEARSLIFSQQLLFDPGTQYSYSNSGYTLLAMILERVSGTSFESLVEHRLLAPAG